MRLCSLISCSSGFSIEPLAASHLLPRLVRASLPSVWRVGKGSKARVAGPGLFCHLHLTSGSRRVLSLRISITECVHEVLSGARCWVLLGAAQWCSVVLGAQCCSVGAQWCSVPTTDFRSVLKVVSKVLVGAARELARFPNVEGLEASRSVQSKALFDGSHGNVTRCPDVVNAFRTTNGLL